MRFLLPGSDVEGLLFHGGMKTRTHVGANLADAHYI